MLEVLRPGIQTTFQGAPRAGYRHMGVPWAGPADAWSMAIANRLVGNVPDALALEITLGGVSFRFSQDTWFALTGAEAAADLSGEQVSFHETAFASAGSVLTIGMAQQGMRIYLAVPGGFKGDAFLESCSTYLPAQFGGYKGRALGVADEIETAAQPKNLKKVQTPDDLRPILSNTYALRACASAETEALLEQSVDALFGAEYRIGQQVTRMGVYLEGEKLNVRSDGNMKSAAVFPGIIQCPENGTPIILLADAQTTGGYPRIASIARSDRHLLGQLRPRDRVRLLRRSHDQALEEARAKQALLQRWIPEFTF